MSEPPHWLQSGLRDDLQLLVIEPLFEEANRCRRMIAQILRQLEQAGVDAAIAELPGTGESPIEIADVRFDDWRKAITKYRPRFTASFRGGALLDDGTSWRFAPETGARVVRDLRRATLTSGNSTLFAGHPLSSDFLTDLEAASPADGKARTVRLATDPADADAKVEGTPLWRRAEPGEDARLAKALAEDLLAWMRTCGAS